MGNSSPGSRGSSLPSPADKSPGAVNSKTLNGLDTLDTGGRDDDVADDDAPGSGTLAKKLEFAPRVRGGKTLGFCLADLRS